MNDQQRIETAADNCEVLRARLARYEDGEGRALQRGGEVLSDEELWSIRNQVAIHQVLRDDDSVKICVKHGRAIEQAVLARLNSSTVSAGDDAQYPPCDYCAEPLSYHPWHGSGLINGVESRHIHACDKCRHLLPAVSAGGVGEREAIHQLAFEIGGTEGGEYWLDAEDLDKVIDAAWQARAALSAPSHGEQVREGWQLVPVEPTDAMLEAGDKYIGTPATYKAMLSACPSPAITKDFSQFLSAVMDAAGLIRHGRQSKELSEYLGMKCMEYRGAALSAPSHGERVREVVPVPLVPTDEMLNAGKSMLHKSNGRGAREKCGRIFAAMLAAAPSAGSQEKG